MSALNRETWAALPLAYRRRTARLVVTRWAKEVWLALKWWASGGVAGWALWMLAEPPYGDVQPWQAGVLMALFLCILLPAAKRQYGAVGAVFLGAFVSALAYWSIVEMTFTWDAVPTKEQSAKAYLMLLWSRIATMFFALWFYGMERALRIASDAKALEAFVKEGVGPQPTMVFPLQMEDAVARIRRRVIGQDAIVEGAVRMVYRRGLMARKGRPLAVLMFVGATGAGKTELAKAMAETLFGKGFLIEVPCNQFNQAHHLDSLLGAPPGYHGSEQGGVLTRQIAQLGRGVILFDEIEKAHPDLLRVIMTLLDEAKVTERSTGRVVGAEQFVIILTSNARQAEIARIVAAVADPEERRQKVRAELVGSGTFAPEQMARVDEVYPFGRLDRAALLEIVALFLERFGEQCGVGVVEADTELLIDLVLQAEQRVAEGGVRDVVRAVEQRLIDGLLEVRMQGGRAAAVRVRDGRVVVEARRTW